MSFNGCRIITNIIKKIIVIRKEKETKSIKVITKNLIKESIETMNIEKGKIEIMIAKKIKDTKGTENINNTKTTGRTEKIEYRWRNQE